MDQGTPFIKINLFALTTPQVLYRTSYIIKYKKSNSSSRQPKKFSSDSISGLDPHFDVHWLKKVKIDAHIQLKIITGLLEELKFLNHLCVTVTELQKCLVLAQLLTNAPHSQHQTLWFYFIEQTNN